jgi:dTDP-4-dehydrorhamnose reductase
MILLTGGSGQLGVELRKLRDYHAPTHSELDITDPDQVAHGVAGVDLIVHAAAYTDTLKPDQDPIEAAKCYRANVLGTRNLVKFATCPIIFISSESCLEPHNFYVLTKLMAELEVAQHHLYRIVRTSFRSNPFEYPKAVTDMWTIADSVENIAPLINSLVDEPVDNELYYVGHEPWTVYELAKTTRPDVEPVKRSELPFHLPEMKGLLHV